MDSQNYKHKEETSQDQKLEKRNKKGILIKIVNDKVLFPGLVAQITFDKKDSSLDLLRDMYKSNNEIGIVKRKNNNSEEINFQNIHHIGTLAQILDIIIKPDNKVHVLLKGTNKFIIKDIAENIQKEKEVFLANIEVIYEDVFEILEKKDKVLIQSLKEATVKLLKNDPEVSSEIEEMVKGLETPAFLAYFAMSGTSASSSQKQNLLEENNILKKVKISLKYVFKDLDLTEMRKNIRSKIHKDITEQQKEFYLRQEIKALQSELGENEDDEIQKLFYKGQNKDWPKEVYEHFTKSLKKAERIPPHSPEYPTYINHAEFLLELPWNKCTTDNFDIERAQKILDKRHFGMEKVKQRILEYLAVLKLKKHLKGPILCLYGPPGVGKTSLGKSIAESLKRKYARISLGALSDEADIRGHRKTYIGAMPGKIMHNIKVIKSSNPVFVLDEIDKLDVRKGNSDATLLELLDPEQNNSFADNFLEVPYDLSKVMFIATANDITQISPALRDRMEMIEITGYTLEEKIEIAKKYIIPDQRIEHGLKASDIIINDSAIHKVIKNYTGESGVRDLKRQIASLNRKIAKSVALGEDYKKTISENEIRKYLGIEKYDHETYQKPKQPGIAIGLAYTSIGGEILYIETSAVRGTGKVTISGQLGDVMKESAIAAISYLKSKADDLKIDYRVFKQYDLHIHLPDGATPKDGPSAGITITSALASLYTQRTIKEKISMTGEITLRGQVLPVGGIKEKILAAKRANINNIILSTRNKKDIVEIGEQYKQGLEFHYVENVDEVLELTLEKKINKDLKGWFFDNDKSPKTDLFPMDMKF